ncbi:MAG: hypothetical protein QXM86_01410 [Candidatus Bathyarchaeia archaeon]
MENKRFTAQDLALTSVFCALWVVLNLILGPLGFSLWNLPILCDFSVFFTLLLTVWFTGKFGTASLVGVVGSIVIFMLRASPHIIGFAISAVLFDLLMLVCKHKICQKPRNVLTASFATIVSAYFAGVIIGIFFSNRALGWITIKWALTFWGILHLMGGIISLLIAFPVIAAMEKANVRKIKSG